MKKYIQSSENPQELSMTLKGILTCFVPLIILLCKKYNVLTSENEVLEVINVVSMIAATLQIYIGGSRRIRNLKTRQ